VPKPKLRIGRGRSSNTTAEEGERGIHRGTMHEDAAKTYLLEGKLKRGGKERKT